MFAHVNTVLKPLDRATAIEFSTMKHAAGERHWKQSRDQWLRSLLQQGLFFTPKWSYAMLNGEKRRLNGQHSSTMLQSLSPEEFPKGLNVCIDEFICDTEQDLAKLFEQFDAAESSRSRGEIINAHARSEKSLTGIPQTKIIRCVDGVAWAIYQAEDGVKLSKLERAALTHSSQNFIQFAAKFAGDRSLGLVSVMAAIYRTWLICDSTSDCFWTQVMNGSHANHLHPTRALNKWLLEYRGNASASGSGKTLSQSMNMHEKCIHQWNAFREGRETKQVKSYANKKGELVAPI